jgi:hypothetical protein
MRIDIYPEYSCLGAKILFPYLQRPTLIYTNFNNMNICASKLRKMAIINRKIMLSLVDQPSGILCEVSFQIIHIELSPNSLPAMKLKP